MRPPVVFKHFSIAHVLINFQSICLPCCVLNFSQGLLLMKSKPYYKVNCVVRSFEKGRLDSKVDFKACKAKKPGQTFSILFNRNEEGHENKPFDYYLLYLHT